MGNIYIQDLKINCIIGCMESERIHTQDIHLDISLDFDFMPSAQNDDVQKTVNYVDVADLITEIVVKGRFKILEAMVYQCATQLLKHFKQVERCTVVAKKNAIPSAKHVRASFSLSRG